MASHDHSVVPTLTAYRTPRTSNVDFYSLLTCHGLTFSSQPSWEPAFRPWSFHHTLAFPHYLIIDCLFQLFLSHLFTQETAINNGYLECIYGLVKLWKLWILFHSSTRLGLSFPSIYSEAGYWWNLELKRQKDAMLMQLSWELSSFSHIQILF